MVRVPGRAEFRAPRGAGPDRDRDDHRRLPQIHGDLVDVKVREPGDDLASDLIAIHREAPERLGLDEIASILFSLSFAGHETTTGLIGNTVRRLLEDPSRWAEIVRRPDLDPGRGGGEPLRDFDLHRTDAERHLAFGKGLHYCLGANLGKLEAQIAVAELARRYPRLELAPDQDFTFHPNISFRGPQILKVQPHSSPSAMIM